MLVAHWPLTESSGDAIDYAGANNGTVTGATQGATGPLGYDCYSFDGVDDYVELGSSFTSSYPFTMSGWCKSSDGGNNYIITIADSSSASDIYALGLRSGNSGMTAYESSFEETTGKDINDGAWHFVAGVWTSSTRYLYTDGILDASDSNGEGFTPLGSASIGRTGDSTPGSYMRGEVFDVRVYDHALTPAEVAALASVGSQAAYVSPKQQL